MPQENKVLRAAVCRGDSVLAFGSHSVSQPPCCSFDLGGVLVDLCCWLQSPPTSNHDHIQRAYIKIPLPSSAILLPQTSPPPSGVRYVPGPRAGAHDGEQRQRVRQDQGEPPQVPPLQANTSPPSGQILINFPFLS